MPALTEYVANSLLDLTFNATAFTPPAATYLTIHTSHPQADGSGTEVTGGGYAREAITFDPAASGSIASDVTVAWTPLQTAADQVIVGWSIWDDPTAGNMLAFHSFSSALLVRANNPVSFAAGDIVITPSSGISDLLAEAWLDHLFNATAYTPPADAYVGQFTVTPTASTPGTEVTGGGYARQVSTWAPAGFSYVFLDDTLSWTPLHTDDDQILSGWAILDDPTAGDVLFFANWNFPVDVPAGDEVVSNSTSLNVQVT